MELSNIVSIFGQTSNSGKLIDTLSHLGLQEPLRVNAWLSQMIWRCLIACVICCPYWLRATPGTPPSTAIWEGTYFHLGADEGLQGKTVYAIYRDRKGFHWFCTDMGVSRYDGYAFHNYSTSDGVTDNDVFGAAEDSHGRLWLLTRSGIPCYYYKGFIHNPNTDVNMGEMVGKNFASAFWEGPDQTVYLGYFDGAAYSMDTTNRIRSYPCQDICRILGFGHNPRLGVYAVHNINQLQSLTRPDALREQISDITINGSENYPVKYLQLSNGVSLFSWGRNIRVMDDQLRLQLHTDVIPSGKILGIFEGRNHSIHVATSEGAYQFADTSFAQPMDGPALPEHAVFSVLEDSRSGFWYGTDHGVYFRPNIACRKLSFLHEQTKRSPTALARLGQGHILAGFDDGTILEFDASLALLKRESIGPVGIKSFHVRDSSEVWIRTSSGLYRRSPTSVARIQNFNARSMDFAIGDSGQVTFCNTNGWSTVDARRYEEFMFGDSTLMHPKAVGECQCYAVKYDDQGRIWIADASGINIWDGNRLTALPSLKALIQYSFVSQILPMQDGMVWFATSGNGLLAYYRGAVRRLSLAEGLSSNFVTAIAKDPLGGIWVGTSKGLQRIDPALHSIGSVSTFQNTAIWFKNAQVQCLLAGDTTLFVGSDDNLYVFDKPGLLQAQAMLHPQIEGVTWGDGFAFADSTIKLNHTQNNLQFEFLALSYLASGNIQYRYRLVGLSNTWSATATRSAQFLALGPGEYAFQVQARMQGGQWSTDMAVYPFEIVAPYWQTAWFIALLISIGVGVAALVLWMVFRSIKQRNELMNRTVIAEQKALITQMNPHFIFNSLNSIQNFFLNNDLENANDYLADFGSLIRLILENGRTSKISLEREILLLTLYIRLESLRLRHKFAFEITADGLDQGRTFLPPMILQPFVENAIWHGLAHKQGPGLVRVQFSRHGRCLQIMVEDDGIGRKRSSELKSLTGVPHKSLATSITMERLEIMRKVNPTQVSFQIIDLVDAQEVGIGTCVSIRLPFDIQEPLSTHL